MNILMIKNLLYLLLYILPLMNMTMEDNSLEILKQRHDELKQEYSQLIERQSNMFKKKIAEIEHSLYDAEKKRFYSDKCTILMFLSNWANGLADEMVKSKDLIIENAESKHDKMFFFFKKMKFQENEQLRIISDKDKAYFFLVPWQILKQLEVGDTKVRSAAPLLYAFSIVNLSKDDLEEKLIQLFDIDPTNLQKLEFSMERQVWMDQHRILPYKYDNTKKILSVIAQQKNDIKYLSRNGSILMQLSELINGTYSFTITEFFKNIDPGKEYDYAKKFVLLKSSDKYCFLVPAAFLNSIHNNNVDKRWIKDWDLVAWIDLYNMLASKSVLESALKECYSRGSAANLRDSLQKFADQEHNKQWRWYKPWTWKTYFRRSSYERDYPARAKQVSEYAADQPQD